MSAAHHHAITTELNSNGTLLRVSFFGNITQSMLQDHLSEIARLTSRTASEFTLFTDLSQLEKMEFSCVSLLAQVMDRFNERGVARVIRVIPNPDKDIGFKILSMFHYSPSTPIITFETLSEAQTLLSTI